jgi:hypothetical protein
MGCAAYASAMLVFHLCVKLMALLFFLSHETNACQPSKRFRSWKPIDFACGLFRTQGALTISPTIVSMLHVNSNVI